MNPIEKQRFEFVLYINGKIICQRYFPIWNFNENVRNSQELLTLLSHLGALTPNSMGEIPRQLKRKSEDFLWGAYNRYYEQQPAEVNVGKNNFEKEDKFTFEIKVDDEPIGTTSFSGNYFPQKVRYSVDIKDIIPSIIADIRYFLSFKEYSY